MNKKFEYGTAKQDVKEYLKQIKSFLLWTSLRPYCCSFQVLANQSLYSQ